MGKFVIKETDAGTHFVLKAANGQVVATSQVYTSHSSCVAGCESVRTNCTAEVEDQTYTGYPQLKNPKYEVFKDKGGAFRFHLKAHNGEIIASSQGYKFKKSCLNGIASIKRNAPSAPILDEEK
ncbi:MAG: YegP family protein [Coriobacteriia bacterium]|nr:YegP family protein [Coriobacteriia bacterium]